MARRVRQVHATELIALHVPNAVVERERLVDVCVARREQLEHAGVAAEHGIDEEPQLFAEIRARI